MNCLKTSAERELSNQKQKYTMLKLDWGDAQIWMDTAEILYLRNVGDSKELSDIRMSGYPHGNELNVAAVCAGYAFELIFKVLVKAGGNQPKARHEPSVAYKHLTEKDRIEVDRIIVSHGWNDSRELLSYLDEKLCHRDRKYWMRTPSGGDARVVFSFGGRKGMDALKRLHQELSELAIRRISDQQVYEIWSGTDQR